MFSLTPLGDLTRFRRNNVMNEAYLITEDVCIRAHGIILAARSAKIEVMLEESESIPAVEFSDDLPGLEDCLDLVYGGCVEIREDNFKTIYKFGKLFQICEMMESVLSWIAISVTYDKFWSVYLELKNLHDDNSVFIDIINRYMNADGDNFMEHSREICHSQDKNTITAVVELLSRIDDITVLSVMENIIDIATENNETLVAATTSSTDNDNYLQTVVSSTVSYIENVIKLDSFKECNSSRCKQVLQKAARVCANMETLRKITEMLFNTNIHKVTNIDTSIQPTSSVKDLNWERVKQLTSPTTPYEAIKYFTENAGTGIHPCVVVEIVLKWWRVRSDREHVDMSFITPLITTIQNVSSEWYDTVCRDERYNSLTETLDNIPRGASNNYIYYSCIWGSNNNTRVLKDCISKGDGTPVQLEELWCSDNMERYRQSIPAFRYNAAVFPPYGDTKHHWYITTVDKRASLITDSKEDILNYINNALAFYLDFVPLPDTQQ